MNFKNVPLGKKERQKLENLNINPDVQEEEEEEGQVEEGGGR